MSRAKLIELSRRALEGDEAAVASLRTEDVDVPDEALLRRAQNRINKIEREAMRVPFEKPKAGFKAYHGTPYRFEQFDLEKIGTGEGAQAYGYGLYFAGEPDVARGYRRTLSKDNLLTPQGNTFKSEDLKHLNTRARFRHALDLGSDEALRLAIQRGEELLPSANEQTRPLLESDLATLRKIQDEGGLIEPTPTDLNALYSQLTGAKATELDYQKAEIVEQIMIDGDVLGVVERQRDFDSYSPEAFSWFKENIEPTYEAPGALYEVDIQADPDALLDWDMPIENQSPKVKKILEDAGLYDPKIKQQIEELEAEAAELALDRDPVTNAIREDKKWLSIKSKSDQLKRKANLGKTGLPIRGRDLYYKLASEATGPNAQRQATAKAQELGFAGIKYFDANSRAAAEGTKNYVIFDPRIIDISKQYGIALPMAGLILANQDAQAAESMSLTTEPRPPMRVPTFENDDATGKVLDARQGADLSPYDRAMMKAQAQQEPMTPFEAIPARAERFAREVTIPAFRDIFGGAIEAPRQAVAGFLDATAEAARVMESIIPLGTISGAEPEYIEIEADPRTVTGAGVRAISQFLTGFVPALRGVKALGVTGVAAPAAAGAIADATVFDPQEERLSNLIQDVPALENPITEYLAASPEDTDAEGRFKNAIEGLALGGVADGLIQGIRLVKNRRALVEVAEAEGKPVEQMIEEAMATMKGGMPVPRDVMPPGQEYIPFDEAAEAVQPTIRVPEFKPGTTEADPEAARNINLANLNTTEDVSTLIDEVAKADAPNINDARRQKITNDELPKLADDLGMTVEDLLARRQGEAFNAEQILAARKILVASGENLVKLANAAKNGSEMDLALFRRAMSQHRAIQSQVSGMTAEAGRALQSFRVVAASSREQERLIKEALETTGGEAVSRDMAAMLSELDSPEKIGRFVKDANKATTKDQLYEIWINGLLSSPTTHMVNILSNTMVAALTVGERKIASAIGPNIPPGETSAQLKGLVDGARDGFRLAWNALKTGEPTDPMQKVEAEKFRAVTSENLNIAGPAGRFADFMGEAIRVPGRLLTAGDEYFKSVGYRMELYAQAYRQAFNEGLRDEAAAKRVIEIIENPPENIKQSAIDASRYQTFTNQLGKTGKAVEQVRNNIPYARVVMPFVRTPVNVMSYAFERTPLAPLSSSFREEIAAGGARRDLAMGKLIAGSMAMAVSADLVMSGSITGAGPTNPKMRNIMRATGWQPYSIKVGDKYYAYNRLDPVGALLGLSADVTEIIGQTTEAEAAQIATAAALSVAQNMASKTYMSGVTDFFDAFFSASLDPESSNYKLMSYLQRQAASVVPASVANIERYLSPEMSATYGFLDRVKSRIPGYSDDLPPRRNIFGEPIVLEGGIGPDIMSPIYTSTVKDDPIADEMVRQQVAVGMPRRQIQGIELDAQQYDRYVLLYSGIEAPTSLKDQLRTMFNTREYKNASDGPEGGKALMIKSVFTAYRDMAQAQMLAEDDQLTNQITLAQEQRVEKLLGR
jgi:hypothetical protein